VNAKGTIEVCKIDCTKKTWEKEAQEIPFDVVGKALLLTDEYI
jgi:hypothetical protein